MATAIAAEPGLTGAMTPLPFRVAEREQNTADTWTLALEALAGEPPVIAPGQFMMVYVFGIGEVPISVSGPPLLLTVRAVGAVSTAICHAETLGIRDSVTRVAWKSRKCRSTYPRAAFKAVPMSGGGEPVIDHGPSNEGAVYQLLAA